jgi:uncharacterized protein YbaP (TraB family)
MSQGICLLCFPGGNFSLRGNEIVLKNSDSVRDTLDKGLQLSVMSLQLPVLSLETINSVLEFLNALPWTLEVESQ